nr:melatonin receptor type 1B-B-like [Lytechinus pictus]
MIAGLWVIGFLIDLPNILGWGTHTFDWKVMSCTGGMSFVYSYAIYFAMTAFAVPLIIITFSYIGIFRFARKATLALERVRNKDGVQNKKGKGGRAARPADLRLARSVLAIVIIYLLMWSPYSLTVLIDHRVVYDRKLYILSYTLAHTNSSFNCVIYGATNQQFRRGYMHFIRLVFCRAKKVDLLASVTGTVGTGSLRNNRVHPAEQTSPATQESAVH